MRDGAQVSRAARFPLNASPVPPRGGAGSADGAASDRCTVIFYMIKWDTRLSHLFPDTGESTRAMEENMRPGVVPNCAIENSL